MKFKGYVIGLAAALSLSAQAAYAQSNTAALVNEFLGVGEQATSTLGSLAAQHQALQLQREQARQMQQAQQLQQDQAEAQRHRCQPGYTGALIVHADGTRELICEQRR
jgi:hypothetical protein